MRKLASIFTIVLFSAATLSAQWSIGIRAQATGNNIQAAKGIESITPQFKMLPGFEVGITTHYGFNDHMALVGEINYSQRGFRVREATEMGLFGMNIPLGILVDTRISNVTVPLIAQYEFGKHELKGFVGLGPEFTYATGARIKARSDSFIDFALVNRSVSLDAINYQKFDVGAVAVAGASYETVFGEIFMDARFRHGFNDLIALPVVDTNVKSYGVGVGFGVRVNIGS